MQILTATYSIDIYAPPDKVWDWLSRIEMWKSWRQDVTSAYWVSGNGRGGTLKWRLQRFLGFTAQVERWDEEREIRWKAVCYRANLDHRVKIKGDFRRTKVELTVSGDGGLLKFPPTRVLFNHIFDRSNEIWLGALKAKLEAGKDDSLTPPPGAENPFSSNVRLPSEITRFER